MGVSGLCGICEAAEADYRCDRCGTVVCARHFDRDAGSCVSCRRGIVS